MESKEICEKAVLKFGERQQIDILIEEMAELTQALSKYKRGLCNNVCEEIADVEICIEQMKTIFRVDKIEGYKFAKLIRLERML